MQHRIFHLGRGVPRSLPRAPVFRPHASRPGGDHPICPYPCGQAVMEGVPTCTATILAFESHLSIFISIISIGILDYYAKKIELTESREVIRGGRFLGAKAGAHSETKERGPGRNLQTCAGTCRPVLRFFDFPAGGEEGSHFSGSGGDGNRRDGWCKRAEVVDRRPTGDWSVFHPACLQPARCDSVRAIRGAVGGESRSLAASQEPSILSMKIHILPPHTSPPRVPMSSVRSTSSSLGSPERIRQR